MNTVIDNDLQEIIACAEHVSKSATAAFWLANTEGVHEDRPRFHLSNVDREFRKMASALGYRVERIAPAVLIAAE